MALGRRLRLNNQLGTLGGSGLTSGGGTITFAVAPGFVTLANNAYYPISVDEGTSSFEVVYLTAYTAGATTGTILRGQEGTTGVSHSAGANWAHAYTVADFPIPPYFWVIEEYGARVDGLVVQDGAMSSSSDPTWLTCATSAPFLPSDVGKVVNIYGAGTSGAVLVATISSYISSSVVVLSTGASTTVSGTQVYFGTDDTAAWRAALSDIGTAGCGIAKSSKPGISMLAGAPTAHPFGSSEGVLNLPYLSASGSGASPVPVVGIEGPTSPSMPFSETNTSVDNTSALVLYACGSGAQAISSGGPLASVINAGLGGGSSFNNLCFYGEKFIVRVPMSSGYHAVNLNWAQQMILKSVYADVAVPAMPEDMVQPLGTNMGIMPPAVGNGDLTIADRAGAFGYYIGLEFNEHFEGDHLAVGFCSYATQFNSGAHSIHIGRMTSQWNTHHLGSWGSTPCPVVIDLLDIEDALSGHWYSTVDHVTEGAGAILTGPCRMARIVADSGLDANYPIVASGAGIHLNLEMIGGPAWQAVDFINGWAAIGGSPTQFRKTASGQVELQVYCTAPGGELVAFVLPVGFRPGQNLDQAFVLYTGTFDSCVCNVDANGNVQFFTTAVGPIPDGQIPVGVITFTAEN